MGARGPRVAIKTLGCKVNRTESESLAESLLGSDCILVDQPEGADLVVVNTCTVTGEADAKARKEVRRALTDCAGPVVVTGCLAALDADGLRAIAPRVVVEQDRQALAARVRGLLGVPVAAAGRPATRSGDDDVFRTRVMLKVQDGCDHRCSYCIVPDARGIPRSVPADEVLARAASLADAGTKEIVLTGINIGRYADAAAGIADLPALIDPLCTTGIPRIRVSSIEPLDLTPAFVDSVRRSDGRVVPHLHVPLQSGCDRTLHEMRRGYAATDFASVLQGVRDAVPGVAVTTDIIVGFPGETEEDFAESLRFVETCGFARLHVFRYSRRTGTPAAQRADQVPAQAIAERAAAMRDLSDTLNSAWLGSRAGELATALVERSDGATATGTTEDGIRVVLHGEGLATGHLVPVRLRLARDGRMHADSTDPEEASGASSSDTA